MAKKLTSDMDYESTLSPIELKQEKIRRRVAKYRNSLTAEQKAEINRKRREREEKFDKELTSDMVYKSTLSPIELKREKNRKRVAKYRNFLTAEQKAEINKKRRERREEKKKEQKVVQVFFDRRKKQRDRMAAYRKSLTPEQKAEMNERRRERQKEIWLSQTEEEREKIRQIRREKRAEKLESLTLKEQIEFREKERLRTWEYRQSLSLEEKEEQRRKDRERKSLESKLNKCKTGKLNRCKTGIIHYHEFSTENTCCPCKNAFVFHALHSTGKG